MYTIYGTPVSAIKASFAGRKILDDFNVVRFNQQQQLRHQHDDRPFITGLWHLQADFYFDKDYSKSRGYSPCKPAISVLLRYLADILQGVVYENELVIDEINACKYYGADRAKTILIFTRRERSNGCEEIQREKEKE